MMWRAQGSLISFALSVWRTISPFEKREIHVVRVSMCMKVSTYMPRASETLRRRRRRSFVSRTEIRVLQPHGGGNIVYGVLYLLKKEQLHIINYLARIYVFSIKEEAEEPSSEILK